MHRSRSLARVLAKTETGGLMKYGAARNLAILGLLVFSSLASAEPIPFASIPIFAGGSISTEPIVNPELQGVFMFSAERSFDPFESTVFNVTLTEAAVGTTFRASRQTDAAFDALARTMSNGIDDQLQHSLFFDDTVYSRAIAFESDFLQGFPRVGPDLLGSFMLTDITFRLDEFFVAATRDSRAVTYRGVMTFEGVPETAPVPEPATFALLATGAAALGGQAWRRRRRLTHAVGKGLADSGARRQSRAGDEEGPPGKPGLGSIQARNASIGDCCSVGPRARVIAG
jgi:hypothetical protein